MSEQNPTPDATPTEALELPDQQPVVQEPVAAAPAAPQKGNHTRTILEVVGGVVAAGLIVVAGIAGFAVGHATGSDNEGRWSMSGDARGDGGPRADAGGPMGDQRGIDPDGDNWTGQNGHDGDHGWGDDGDDDGMMPGGPMGQPGQPAPQAPGQ